MSMERSRSEELFKRAVEVVPGGIYGHVSPAGGLPNVFPHYAESAEGCRFRDVDGNEWLDFMCGYGAVLLGHRDPEVEEAAERQRRDGAVLNQPTARMVELAEAMVERIDFADWAVFAKNGSDVTTWATRVAREETGRSLILKAKGAYHGVDAWCDPGLGGRIPEDRAQVVEFTWNDLDEVSDVFDKRGDEVAAVVLTPYHHAAFGPSEMPLDGFWSGVEKLCREKGALLVLDDVRAGFRLHEGGSHRLFGFTPDLACYSKALGNGYAISACLGKGSFRKAAGDVFLTGSCWNDAVAMAAALKCLEVGAERKVVERVEALGKRLAEGLVGKAEKHGLKFAMTGPPSMPYPWFDGDDNLYLLQEFCSLCAQDGVFFHPHHNWFLCGAHDEGVIDQALGVAGNAMEELARKSSR